jgi:predicted RecA/RadA family phage recombinase
MKNCIRPDGRSIPLAVPYSGGVTAGQGVLVGALFGVAQTGGAQNEVVECAVVGEFELTKEPSLAISVGARVYWDNTNRRITTSATGNFHVGFCTVAALATDTTVRVLLGRGPAAGA